ncbi:UNVERIFIED_CONTAM: putative membrane protein DUF2339 [Acetivibrio alkalicellulosi]
MKDLLKKHWITLLGAVFIFIAFSYTFKFAVDQGWVSNEIRIGIGLIAAAGFIIGGASIHQKGKHMACQIISGLGVSLAFTTFTFAGIYYNMWSPMTVFLAMVAVTLALSIYSYRYDFRILMNIALIGGLISPIVMKSQGDQVFTLFLYLLIINTIFFYVSVQKKWSELRLIPFLGTWILFTVYYLYFNPQTWYMPFRYALSAFVFYVVGFMISSWKEDKNFDGLNLYLGITNGGIFILWSIPILSGNLNFSFVLGSIGILYLLVSFITQYLTKKTSIPVLVNFYGGLLFLLIAANEIGSGLDIKNTISVYLWTFISIGVLIVGQIKNKDYLKLVSYVIWIFTGLYWATVTIATPSGIWFGKFIPIFNWSGIAWLLLAILGFYFSIKVTFNFTKKENPIVSQNILSNFASISSHLIVGLLLTIQIIRFWSFYNLDVFSMALTISVAWALQALLLFLWGSYSNQSLFRWFGSIVLLITALKTIFFDLSGSDTIYKILVLFILGIISFSISYINGLWKPKDDASLEKSMNV